ncbi:Deuterolysin metalloprotease family-domain-containing protein [Poronia punctata]|nr:Deuterolysin metalloprotease family-domain-containing protein [Poronia punctata]
MISNILPVAALAGAAMAACPLSVEVTNVTGHVAQVAVTNTASEPITVFRGNTILSSHATKDLYVADAGGKPLPFEGKFVKYRRTGISSDMFQTLQPGETVKSSVNAASTYKLSGVEQAQINAVQGFHYVKGSKAPSKLSETEFCSAMSNSVSITPDQKTAAADHLHSRYTAPFKSRIQKRDVSYSDCSSDQTSSLQTSVSDAISLASAAQEAAGAGEAYFTTWFKDTSVTETVQGIYGDVTGVQSTSPTISCTDAYDGCGDGSALLYTVPSANVIVPCPDNGYWDFPEYADNCVDDDYDRAGSILHEMTHLYGTDDYAYGQSACLGLSASEAAANADSYEIYAGSVRLGGCDS